MINKNKDTHFDLLNKLKHYNVDQFSSYISGSQYIKAYELVDKYSHTDGNALDWGAGNGHFSYYLLTKGLTVTSFNLNPECQLSGTLSEIYNNRYTYISARESVIRLPFTDDHFDLVTSIGVLEHVQETGGDVLSSVKEIARILKPGSLFICYHFPNKYSWIEFISEKIKNKYHHEYKFTRSDICNIVNKSGLQLITTKRYGILPRLIFRNRFKSSIIAYTIFNYIDDIISFTLNIFCQNHYFVAYKPNKQSR